MDDAAPIACPACPAVTWEHDLMFFLLSLWQCATTHDAATCQTTGILFVRLFLGIDLS